MLVLYGTQKGTCKTFAEQLAVAVQQALAGSPAAVQERYGGVQCSDVARYEPERLLSDLPPGSVLLLVISTYEGGTPPTSARWFCRCEGRCTPVRGLLTWWNMSYLICKGVDLGFRLSP